MCTDALIFEKVHSRAVRVAAATRLHNSHDKVTGEKDSVVQSTSFVATYHWMKVPGKVFHEVFRLAMGSRTLGQGLLLPGEEGPSRQTPSYGRQQKLNAAAAVALERRGNVHPCQALGLALMVPQAVVALLKCSGFLKPGSCRLPHHHRRRETPRTRSLRARVAK